MFQNYFKAKWHFTPEILLTAELFPEWLQNIFQSNSGTFSRVTPEHFPE
jgi:hypothetical protein